MKKTKAVVKVGKKVPQKSMPERFIEKAIDKGLDVQAIEKLMTMRRELRAEFAEEEFNKAMAELQSECPVIKRSKEGGKTKSGQVAYMYAPLDQIKEETRDLIKKHGFSYIFKTGKTESRVLARCIVKHIAGHEEESTVDLPLTTGTNVMSSTQVEAATMTFAKRYAFCDAFGIVTGGDDNEKVIQEESEKKEAEKEKKIDIAKKLIKGRTTVAQLEKDIEMVQNSSYDEMEKDYLILEAQQRIEQLSKKK